MKQLNNFIIEKLKINSKSKVNSYNLEKLKELIISEIYEKEDITKNELNRIYLTYLNDNKFMTQMYLGESEEKYLMQKLPKEFLEIPKERKILTFDNLQHIYWIYKLEDLLDFYNGDIEELVNDLKIFFE